MSKLSRTLPGRMLALAAGCSLISGASAAVYVDSTGDNAGGPDVDISSVEVSNDLTDISFKITLVGDISVANWGNYHIGLDTVPGGSTAIMGPWGNPIGMSSGMDYWIGSWVNWGGGASLFQWTGSAWTQTGSPAVTLGQYSATITTSLASLGLADGSTFYFDVWSSFGNPGGQSAYDASSNPALAVAQPWVTNPPQPYDSGSLVSTYTVPEPAAIAAIGVVAAGLLGRRRW